MSPLLKFFMTHHLLKVTVRSLTRAHLFLTQKINAFFLKSFECGTSLAVQWLRLHTCNAGVAGSIPGQKTKIPHHALRCGQK